jgi:hypothetical protein
MALYQREAYLVEKHTVHATDFVQRLSNTRVDLEDSTDEVMTSMERLVATGTVCHLPIGM